MNENSPTIVKLLWRIKLRLQFTGWLQYMPPGVFSLILFLVAGVAYLINWTFISVICLVLGVPLLAIFLFDLVTVKFRLRPSEPLPERVDEVSIFDLMRSRRSCRSFQTRSLTPADFAELMDSLSRHSAAPTIGDAPIRFEYVSAPLTVWPVVNATQFLVAIAPKDYNRLAVIDVGRSLQKVVMDATRMGLATCWIGPGADHASILRHLGDRFDSQRDHIICVCAVGYKSRYVPLLVRVLNRQLYGRLPLTELFFEDASFSRPLPTQRYPFDQFGRSYEICQWSPSSYNGQTTRCVAVVEPDELPLNERRVTRFDFYAATDSRYYAAVALGIWVANWELGCGALGIYGRPTRVASVERSDQGLAELPELPRYDVSWVLDEPLPTTAVDRERIPVAVA